MSGVGSFRGLLAVTALLAAWPSGADGAFELRWPNAGAAALAVPLDRWPPRDAPSPPRWSVELSMGELYGLEEASGRSVRCSLTSGAALVEVDFSQFGSPLYRESSCGVTLVRPVGEGLSCSLGLRGMGLSAAGLPGRWTVVVDAGLGVRLLGRISLSAAWENVNRGAIGGSSLSTRTTLAGCADFGELTFVSTALFEGGFDPTLSLGCEARAGVWFRLRAGVAVSPERLACGVGIGDPFRGAPVVDLAWDWHPDLGTSYFVSVSLAPERRCALRGVRRGAGRR